MYLTGPAELGADVPLPNFVMNLKKALSHQKTLNCLCPPDFQTFHQLWICYKPGLATAGGSTKNADWNKGD